jgi:hypothetical protein
MSMERQWNDPDKEMPKSSKENLRQCTESVNTLDPYLGGARIEPQPGHRLS